jgi:hypothetical protein
MTISNTGVTAIGAGKVTNAMLAGSIDLTSKVTGVLPLANGGTGLSSVGTNGQLLSSNGTGIVWTNPTATVTASTISGTTLASNVVTSSLTSVGTIISGVWSGTAIASNNIASALTGKTYNGLTPTEQATGFTLAGGTTSKTLTVSNDATVSGTNTGDQTITLTGDVTGSGTGTFTSTIGTGKVTNAMLAGSIDLTSKVTGVLPLANGGTGLSSVGTNGQVLSSNGTGIVWTNPTATVTANTLSGTTLASNVVSSSLTSLGTITSGVWSGTAIASNNIASALNGKTYNGLTPTAQTTGFTLAGGTTSKTLTVTNDATVSGTNTGDQTITLTGDVTGSGTGTFTSTIGAGKVTNAMLAGSIDLTSKVTGILPVANGGTGSSTQNFVDLSNTQTVAGAKTFSGATTTISGNLTGGNAATSTLAGFACQY